MCLWRGGAGGRGALLSGDIVQVVADRDWVSFMYSYPNLIPLPAAEIVRIRAADRGARVRPRLRRLVGRGDRPPTPAKVLRSADRYLRALGAGWMVDR